MAASGARGPSSGANTNWKQPNGFPLVDDQAGQKSEGLKFEILKAENRN
jgi:hypothetical protein